MKEGRDLSALRRLPLSAAEHLFPGYFALVMATGIVSIACHLLDIPALGHLLLAVNWVAYLVLWGLTLLRLCIYPREVLGDLCDHQRAPGFFTVVAGTCVLGTQTVVLTGGHPIAGALWWCGLGLWVAVMYGFFTAVMVQPNKPSLEDGINGAWLMAAVATQSLVVLRGVLDAGAAASPEMQFLSFSLFLVGCLLYLAIIPLILYRLTFLRLSSREFTPPYWINMGAIAITTLAGAMLVGNHWPLLAEFEPFLKGFTLFFWAAATWWIPLLLALMVWRYLVRGDRPGYEPQLWGMVFPLGMYAAGTHQLARAFGLPFLVLIPKIFVAAAIAAWLAAFAGLLGRIAAVIRAGIGEGGTAEGREGAK